MKAFDKLKERIKEHRRNCIGWKKMKPCFNCHVNTLTEIDEEINGRNKD